MGDEGLAAVGYTVAAHRFGDPTFLLGYRYFFEKRELAPGDVLRTTLQGPVIAVTFHL